MPSRQFELTHPITIFYSIGFLVDYLTTFSISLIIVKFKKKTRIDLPYKNSIHIHKMRQSYLTKNYRPCVQPTVKWICTNFLVFSSIAFQQKTTVQGNLKSQKKILNLFYISKINSEYFQNTYYLIVISNNNNLIYIHNWKLDFIC